MEQTFTITPAIKLSSTSLKAGASTTVTVSGFAANEMVALSWDGGAVIKSVTASATGGGSTSVTIPDAPGGDHTITASGSTSGLSAGAAVTVIPGVTISPTAGTVGRTATVTLRGYDAGEAISIDWHDSATATVTLGTATASSLGSASVVITIPEASKGSHQVDGTGSSGSLSSATFTVTSSIAISPTSGAVGTSINVTATGFAAGESISVQWFETTTQVNTIATLTASDKGSAAATLAIPESVNGSHKIQVTGHLQREPGDRGQHAGDPVPADD